MPGRAPEGHFARTTRRTRQDKRDKNKHSRTDTPAQHLISGSTRLRKASAQARKYRSRRARYTPKGEKKRCCLFVVVFALVSRGPGRIAACVINWCTPRAVSLRAVSPPQALGRGGWKQGPLQVQGFHAEPRGEISRHIPAAAAAAKEMPPRLPHLVSKNDGAAETQCRISLRIRAHNLPRAREPPPSSP